MFFFTDDISLRARYYIVTVILLGLSTLIYSLSYSLFLSDLSWLLLLLITVIGSFLPVRLPFARDNVLTITATDVFVYTSILLYCPEVAVIVSATDGFLAGIRRVKRPYRITFNVSQLSFVTFVAGRIFYQLQGQQPPLEPSQLENLTFLFLNLSFCALIHFILNSGSVALAISLVTGRPLTDVWKENFHWASPATVAGAATAALVFLNFDRMRFFAVAMALPIVLVVYYAYKTNLDRINQAQKHIDQLDELYHSTIASLAMAIDAKDRCTHGHVNRVQALALGLAKHCGVTDEKNIAGLRAASLLHDIGKLAIPEYILNKPSTLSESEMQKMKAHPTIGADILESVPFPYPVVPFVRYHHEKWNGTGYPEGLKGEKIPLGARILAIADCYDALRSDRPYRAKLTREVTLEYIKKESDKSYDPAVVVQLLEHIDELEIQVKAAEAAAPQTPLRIGESQTTVETDRQKETKKKVLHDIASAHREVQAIYELSQNVGKILDVPETLALLGAKIQNLVPYGSCTIYLLNSQNDKLVPYHTSGPDSELLENLEIAIGDGVSGWVAANNQSLMNVPPTSDFRNTELLHAEFKSCLAMPLSTEKNVIGVITLYSNVPEAYDHDHLRIMEAVAHPTAAAINNAIIYEETQKDAYTDALTGLPNLRYFKVFGRQELTRAARTHYPVTLLMMDLEFFKEVNDRFGHKMGDRILIEIAHLLRSQMRSSDNCIRYGGDEFLGVLSGVSNQLAGRAVRRIQAAVDQHRIVLNEHHTIQIGVSIGRATFPDDGEELDALLALADQAMYRDKIRRTKRDKASAPVLSFEKHSDSA